MTPSGVSRMVKRGALTPAHVIQAGYRGVFLFDPADVRALAEKRRRADAA
ncbi:hypothetical protein IU485_28335 [Nocardia cyriacigeorgica]|nr:hypothetical protein [Nocardia cyriacigeorgica]